MMKHRGTRTLTTNRLVLRRFERSDEEAIYENWAGDPEAARYLTWRAHSSRKITRDVLESWVRHYTPRTYRWGIVWKETGELIGSVDVVRTDEESGTGELGYVLCRRFWRRGIIPEAASAVLRYCFEQVGYERMAGEFDADNPSSGRVLEKLGMHYAATIEGKYRTNQGEPCTVLRYELRREEWEAVAVRRAWSHEVADVGRLYAALADDLKETGRPGPGWIKHVYPRTATAWEAFSRGELFVAVRAGRVVGTVILNDRQDPAYRGVDWIYPADAAMVVHTLAVHPRACGQGIAHRLLALAEEEARRRGLTVLRLDTFIENAPAIRLYEACGFHRTARIDLGIAETFGLNWFYAFEKRTGPPSSGK